MTQTAHETPIHVRSIDGTSIAAYVSGHGRPLVVVPGTSSDHGTWHQVQARLDPHLSPCIVDRRGRGASGDATDYTLELECADIAAVVEAAASRYNRPVDLLGHSFGGNIAFRVAADSDKLRRLVLYEGWPPPNLAHRTCDQAVIAHLDSLVTAGRLEQMLVTFYREVVGMTTDEVDALVASPSWPARVAAARTVPRELRAFGEHAFEREQAARISVPTLLLVGSESPEEVRADPEVVASAIPGGRIRVLDGQSHIAHLTAPDVLAAEVVAFLSET
jgi:pimeloyl-ACP methyl ester carboxylesterase